MKLRFLGHASFLLTTNAGTRLLTDPYDPNHYPGALLHAAYDGPADIVTVSHSHADHGYLGSVQGSPVIIRSAGKYRVEDVEVEGIATHHDDQAGSKRGANIVFVVKADGIRLAHLGDLGHALTAEQAVEIGQVDVGLIPVGGTFTIDASQAGEVADQIGPRIIIPMHYRNKKCLFNISGVDDFLQGKEDVVRHPEPELELNPDNLPEGRRIVVLKPTL